MAKVSFAAAAQGLSDPAAESQESSGAVVPTQPSMAMAPVRSANGIEGEVGRGDINLPRLSLVQGVGPLSELFKPGQLVLNKETVLTDGEKPVVVTVVRLSKSYLQNLPYEEGGGMPERVNTLAEVKARGGTIEYADNEPPSWIPVADTLVLLESATDDPAFPFEHNGKFYAAALWTLRKSAYTRAAKSIMTASEFALRNQPLALGKWSLTTSRVKLGQNFVYVPILRMTGKNSPEFVAWVTEMGLQ